MRFYETPTAKCTVVSLLMFPLFLFKFMLSMKLMNPSVNLLDQEQWTYVSAANEENPRSSTRNPTWTRS